MHLFIAGSKKSWPWMQVVASGVVILLLLTGCARLRGQRAEERGRTKVSWSRQAARAEALKRAEEKAEAREKLRAQVRKEVAAQKELPGKAPPTSETKAEAAPAEEKPQLTELDLTDFTGGLRLAVGSTAFMQYTAFMLEAPPRLVINVFGTGVGAFRQPMEVNRDPVKTISAAYMEEKDFSRLEIELTGSVPYDIEREKNRIVVSLFSKPGAEPEAVEKPPAIKVTALRSRQLEGSVRVEAEFTGQNPQFKVVRLKEPLRLVLEIRDALVEKAQKLEPEAPQGALKSVSLSQSEEAGRAAARVVAMLTQATPYIVYQEGNTVKLDIDNPPPAPITAKAVPEAAPVKPAPEEKVETVAPGPPVAGKYTGTRISLDFQDAEISDILRLLTEVSGLNIITGPNVGGKVNIKMENVPWDQALDLILRTRGFDKLREGNVLWVDSAEIIQREKLAIQKEEEARAAEEARRAEEARAAEARKAAPAAARAEEEQYVTRVFAVNYVATTRSGTGGLTTSAGGGEAAATGVSTITTEDAPDIWGTITEGLNMILFGVASTETTRSQDKKMLIINKFAGIIQITATPDEMARAAEFLKTAEDSFLRQVMIEASIVEVTLSDDFQMGIDWTLVADIAGDLRGGLNGGELATQSLTGTGVPATIPTRLFRFAVTNEHLNVLLDAISAQGQINTLSNPKLSALNNQKAVIKVGREEVFFDVVTTVSEGVSTTSATARNITVGLVLDVTPQVNPDGRLTMWVHPSITELLEIVSGPGGASAPRLTTRETDTVVTMENGQTLVLAGLIQDRVQRQRTGVPFLSKIPLLGAFFRQSVEEKDKSELVIFITPTIIEGETITELSTEEMKQFQQAPQRFFRR